MTRERIDYTGKMGRLYPPHDDKPEWPMYSYERPAWNFWNGVANGLRDMGYSDEQIKGILQSKAARWLLDKHDDKLQDLGYSMANEAADLSPVGPPEGQTVLLVPE